MTSLPADVLLVTGPDEARQVLDDDRTFRAARMEEYVPGVSRSFFLATDVSDPESGARCREALAAFLAPDRLRALHRDLIAPAAAGRVAKLAAEFRATPDYLRSYGRQVSYALAGIDAADGPAMVAKVRLAGTLLAEDRRSADGRALINDVKRQLRSMALHSGFAPDGLPGLALARRLATVDEAVLLALPLLEMAAFDMNTSLAAAALRRTAQLSPAEQRELLDPAQLRRLVWEAAADLTDLLATRVATCPMTVGATPVAPGDRVVVDLHAANQTGLDHLSFGRGRHACMGRELAMTIGIAPVKAILRRGWIAAQTGGDLVVRIHPWAA
ncbi:hypothetical protein [Plantactinospora sp. KBS50]|uniref:hypothetical protein n=1 Tax=Plantactinospora sp. KBS50 TaxID=2024580 RepID=UPI000BAAEF39|nr:hypothetical protein [Plantactinospora sp. KBS50]ASW56477.1 hypothetical protein CIK06_23425 [Plantactinospora sp. KBS50]